jgi:hypothetical protein
LIGIFLEISISMHQMQSMPLTKEISGHEKKPRLTYPEFLLPFLKSYPPLSSAEVKKAGATYLHPLYSVIA